MLERLAAGEVYACRKLADDAEVDDHIIGAAASASGWAASLLADAQPAQPPHGRESVTEVPPEFEP